MSNERIQDFKRGTRDGTALRRKGAEQKAGEKRKDRLVDRRRGQQQQQESSFLALVGMWNKQQFLQEYQQGAPKLAQLELLSKILYTANADELEQYHAALLAPQEFPILVEMIRKRPEHAPLAVACMTSLMHHKISTERDYAISLIGAGCFELFRDMLPRVHGVSMRCAIWEVVINVALVHPAAAKDVAQSVLFPGPIAAELEAALDPGADPERVRIMLPCAMSVITSIYEEIAVGGRGELPPLSFTAALWPTLIRVMGHVQPVGNWNTDLNDDTRVTTSYLLGVMYLVVCLSSDTEATAKHVLGLVPNTLLPMIRMFTHYALTAKNVPVGLVTHCLMTLSDLASRYHGIPHISSIMLEAGCIPHMVMGLNSRRETIRYYVMLWIANFIPEGMHCIEPLVGAGVVAGLMGAAMNGKTHMKKQAIFALTNMFRTCERERSHNMAVRESATNIMRTMIVREHLFSCVRLIIGAPAAGYDMETLGDVLGIAEAALRWDIAAARRALKEHDTIDHIITLCGSENFRIAKLATTVTDLYQGNRAEDRERLYAQAAAAQMENAAAAPPPGVVNGMFTFT